MYLIEHAAVNRHLIDVHLNSTVLFTQLNYSISLEGITDDIRQCTVQCIALETYMAYYNIL